jgi:hypothetical protein
MNIRRPGLLLFVLLATGASPAMADCCSTSDILGCVAAVATDGLSCEVQAIVDTVNDLLTGLKNIHNETDGVTQSAESAARLVVTNDINAMTSVTQQGASDLAAALSQSQVIYSEEKNYKVYEKTSVVNNASLIQANGQPVATTQPELTARVSNNQLIASADGKKPSPQRQEERPAGSTNAAPSDNSLHSAELASGAGVSQNAMVTRPAPGAYDDIMLRGSKRVAELKSAGDADVNRMNQLVSTAQQSEGPGVQSAEQLAYNLINAPLTALESWLGSLLSNPLSIFDPSSAVDDAENKILNNLDSNLDAMINDISAGPIQIFNDSKPTYDDLQGNAELAQNIVAAMDRLYKQRSTAALDALAGLLPKVDYAGLTHKVSVAVTSNQFAKRMTYGQLSAQFALNKQNAMQTLTPRLQKFKASLAKLKLQRSQGRPMQSAAVRQNNQNSLTQILNGRFAGKSAAGVAAERDQLVAQARSRYAKDPKTETAVINLLNNEAAKHSNGAMAATTVQAAPQPGQSAAFSQVMQPQTQAKTLVPASAVSTAQAPAKPPVAWGTANGWKPPTSTGVQAPAPGAPNFKVAPVLRIAQPVPGSVPAPAAPNAAPSSLSP